MFAQIMKIPKPYYEKQNVHLRVVIYELQYKGHKHLLVIYHFFIKNQLDAENNHDKKSYKWLF